MTGLSTSYFTGLPRPKKKARARNDAVGSYVCNQNSPPRHCERSEAIQEIKLDCHAPRKKLGLAMTG